MDHGVAPRPEAREQNVLVVDVGTSSMKAYLYAPTGECLFSARRSYRPEARGDAVEMDGGVAVEALEQLLHHAADWMRGAGLALGALSLTSQRSSVMGVGEDGTRLTRMMMWQDERSQAVCEGHRLQSDFIHGICGSPPSPVFSAPKIQWFRERRPEVYRDADRFVGFYELMLFRLTGRWLTDDSIASRSCLMDLQTGQWSSALAETFGVDVGKLSEIRPVGSTCSPSADVAALFGGAFPIVLAGGDQQCAALGGGCLQPGDIQINTGTGGYALGMLAPDAARDQRDIRYSRASLRGRVLAECGIPYCCSAVDRVTRLLCAGDPEPARSMAKLLRGAPAQGPGPSLTPEEAGNPRLHDDATLRAMLVDMASRHGEAAVMYALLDSIARELSGCAARVARANGGRLPDTVFCGGGLTNSRAFCELLAKALQRNVAVPKNENVTALGALLVAWRALTPQRSVGDAWREQMRRQGLRLYPPA